MDTPFRTRILYNKYLWCNTLKNKDEMGSKQAKRMNVESLRGNKDQGETAAEIRIAKVAIGILCLYILSWTPYAMVALIAAFGNR